MPKTVRPHQQKLKGKGKKKGDAPSGKSAGIKSAAELGL